jgi:hypothetical protein
MARVGKVALPGHDLSWTSVFSSLNPSANPQYALSNLRHRDPAYVYQSAGNSDVITLTHAGDRTPVGVFLFNSNATSAAIANGNGLDEAITLPGLDLEGQRRHAFLSLAGLDDVTDGAHDIELATTDPTLWIGRIALVTALQDVNYSQDAPPKFDRTRPGNTTLRTRLGSVVVNDATIRTRFAEFLISLEEDRATYEQLDASAHGSILPFPYLPFDDENDAWWVTLPVDFSERLRLPFTEINLRLEELSGGPPNG